MDSGSGSAVRGSQAGMQDASYWDAGRWRSRAACRGVDADLFFPVASIGPGAAQIAAAKQVCARCPVRQACLDFALSSGQGYGIWGGYTEEERRTLRRQRRARAATPDAAQPCGPRLAG